MVEATACRMCGSSWGASGSASLSSMRRVLQARAHLMDSRRALGNGSPRHAREWALCGVWHLLEEVDPGDTAELMGELQTLCAEAEGEIAARLLGNPGVEGVGVAGLSCPSHHAKHR